uniref:Uncharacterized protein n=1 Tax=Ditylenchus dipsaci TaxID=166011 RepID=A0A915CYA0_9BILA
MSRRSPKELPLPQALVLAHEDISDHLAQLAVFNFGVGKAVAEDDANQEIWRRGAKVLGKFMFLMDSTNSQALKILSTIPSWRHKNAALETIRNASQRTDLNQAAVLSHSWTMMDEEEELGAVMPMAEFSQFCSLSDVAMESRDAAGQCRSPSDMRRIYPFCFRRFYESVAFFALSALSFEQLFGGPTPKDEQLNIDNLISRLPQCGGTALDSPRQ